MIKQFSRSNYLLTIFILGALCSCQRVEVKQFNTWMSHLPDTINISKLSIPGTHNSGADCGIPYVKCQTLSIKEQLNAGIRAMDIRLRRVNNKLELYHSTFSLEKSWESVLDSTLTFLKDHPRESVIFFIKSESSAINSNTPLDSLLYYSIYNHKDNFYLKQTLPSLKEARGKIVLLRRFKSKIADLGGLIDQKHNQITTPSDAIKGTTALLIQDCYSGYSIFNRDKKWDAIMDLENLRDSLSSIQNRDSSANILTINFLSGTGIIIPQHLSSYINKKMYQYLIDYPKNKKPHFGIVMMDFAGTRSPNLIGEIINANLF